MFGVMCILILITVLYDKYLGRLMLNKVVIFSLLLDGYCHVTFKQVNEVKQDPFSQTLESVPKCPHLMVPCLSLV